MTATSGKAKVQFIFVTILLEAIGMGILIPVMPDVLRRFTTDPIVVSDYFGYFLGAYAAMQFIASPILGSFSDRFGRRPILLVSLIGAGIDYLFMAFAPNLPLLFLGRIISGLTGAGMTVAASYMADISDDSNRSSNFGLIGAAFGLGFIAGPMLGGVLSVLGPYAPFLAAAGLNTVSFLFGLFILPESLPVEHRRQLDVRLMNPLRTVIGILKPSAYATFIWIFFILNVAGQVHPVNWTLYTQLKFHWSNWEVGLSLSFVGVMIAAVQGGLTRVLIPRLGEERALTIGLWISVFSFALFGLATQSWMLYVIVVFFSLSGIAMPALQAMVARQVDPQRQGELQGSLVSLGSLAAIIAPFLFTKLFVTFTAADAVAYVPGSAYLGASALCLIAIALDVRGRYVASRQVPLP